MLSVAESMREVLHRDIKKVPTLRGKTIMTMFYEPSTRTRVSFEQAGKILSADVINVSASSSSVEKGESLYNTARTLQAMNTDILVVRHPHAGAPYFLVRHLDCCIINAGDGAHAHPTQALLDLYTIRRHLGSIEGLKVAIIGDILYSRVARSNLWGLTKMGARVVVCGPPTLLPPDFLNGYRSQEGHPLASIEVETSVERALEGADVVMPLRIQQERQILGHLPSLREYSPYLSDQRGAPEPGQPPGVGHASGAHERGNRGGLRGGPRCPLGHRGAGQQRCGRAHGPAIQYSHTRKRGTMRWSILRCSSGAGALSTPARDWMLLAMCWSRRGR